MRWRVWRRLAMIGSAIAVFIASVLVTTPWVRVYADDDVPSRSIGRASEGRLEHGHVVPPWGDGYTTYSLLGATIGSQYAHGALRDTLLATFAARHAAVPTQRYVLGEIGARQGGPFHGHRTHQHGLSVDIFMPVRNAQKERTTLPTTPWHLFGYGWEFDKNGAQDSYRIDFEELAALLQTLDHHARANHLTLERIIITPEYIPLLLATPTGQHLGPLTENLTRKPVWVRHDEHIHVDLRPNREPPP